MKEYLIKLRPKSSFETIPSSDTFFGAICWAVRTLYGENGDKGLNNLLKRFVQDEDLPFLISSTFPYKILYDGTAEFYFPKPELYTLNKEDLEEIAKKYKEQWQREYNEPHYSRNIFKIKAVTEYKKFKKTRWISQHQFEGILGGRGEKELFMEYLDNVIAHISYETTAVQKNALDRISNSTTGEGQTFYNQEIFFEKDIGLYFLFKTDEIEYFKPVFSYLSDSGIGSNKRMGKNHFWLEPPVGSTFNLNVDDANGFVSLSRYIPNSNNDKIDFQNGALYQVKPVRSKVESREEFMETDIWKDLTMAIMEGSLFSANDKNKMYGSIVEVKETKGKKIYQYGIPYPAWGRLDFGDSK